MDLAHKPDSWVVLRISCLDETIYKLLAGWSGGYLDGDYWQLNSGIVKVEEGTDFFRFHGRSGSLYHVSKHSYGLRMSTTPIYNKLKDIHKDNVILMPKNTNWSCIIEWK